ncbi:hypothetical protein LARV_03942 [Longilinea arvoryzae]|uniref:Uncharacterized protein n=1 Tax=Longilinea arvoryzae TaxID=360412 RepID=A0A0K8MYM6_9CHLR|nr:hypothetical protein [Longilinea arvoryzae]GAP16146.1 hypothetical protein LARV_03942 [Longilinea arvoryzae]
MNAEREMALQLADLLDGFRSETDPLSAEEREFLKLGKRLRALRPTPAERRALLEHPPHAEPARRGAHSLRQILAPALALILLAAAILVIPQLIGGALNPAGPAQTGPSALALAPDVCDPGQSEPSALGGGEVTGGDFDFRLGLVCDPRYHREAADSAHFSEIDGLAVAANWRYTGVELAGRLTLAAGIEPYVNEIESDIRKEAIVPQLTNESLSGLKLPAGVFPDWKAVDARLRYVLKVQLPDGTIQGAALVFTLLREADGFRPADVTVEPLTEAERASLDGSAVTEPPFPLLNTAEVYPEVSKLQDLLARRLAEFASPAGWIHQRWQSAVVPESIPGSIAEGSAEQGWWKNASSLDRWSLIDSEGTVLAQVDLTSGEGGGVYDWSVLQNGTYRTQKGQSYRRENVAYDGADQLGLWMWKILDGGAYEYSQEIIDGRTAWVFTFHDPIDPPRDLDDGLVTSEQITIKAIDAQSGAYRYTDTYRVADDGRRTPTWRMRLVAEEHIDEPPEAAMALFKKPWPTVDGLNGGSSGYDSIPLALVPDVCMPESVTPFTEDMKRRKQFAGEELSGGLLGGGELQSGAFTFDLHLACDPLFRRALDGGDDYSELDGLGLALEWTYQGTQQDGRLTTYAGVEPYVVESSGVEPVNASTSDASLIGLTLPAGVIPDWRAGDVELRYVVKAQPPDGSIAGAALVFKLQREAQGFRPVDIRVEALSAAEMESQTAAAVSEAPFPTLSAQEVYPELGEIQSLLAKRGKEIAAGAGWIHFVVHNYDAGGTVFAPQMQDTDSESWYQLDYQGKVIAQITHQTASDGRLLQQVVTKDGQTENRTTGEIYPYQPYAYSPDWGLLDLLFDRARSGETIEPWLETIDGRTAWVYSFADTFDPPLDFGDVDLVARIETREAVDAESGAFLFSESVRTYADGSQKLDSRQTVTMEERVDLPPDDALAVFGLPSGGYRPAEPYGTPAAQGSDFSGSDLTLVSQPGDDFSMPSFWYGDIHTGETFLGRVDFGATPGGWCARSTGGDRLAFEYEVDDNGSTSATLRWFQLEDVNQVYNPAPQLRVASQLAWSPTADELAFSACQGNNEDCGLYLLDAKTNTVKRLAALEASFWEPLWKPDGSQVAVIGSGSGMVFVVDAQTGERVYTGKFDLDAWQPAEESALAGWGVSFARSWDGGNCFTESK